jgi:hypothetical protein
MEMHWAAEMALRLLSARAEGEASGWQPWLDSLPQSVVTPVEFNDAEVALLTLPGTVQVRRWQWQCAARDL